MVSYGAAGTALLYFFVFVAASKMRVLLPCVLCVAMQLVVSLPLEPSGVAVEGQLPQEQQVG
jgi:hypothetical protein